MVVLSALVMAVFEVIVGLDCGRIEDLEAVQVVVLRVVEAAGGRYNEKSFVVQHNVLAEAVLELLRVVVVSRDGQHRLLILDRHFAVMQVAAGELSEALSVRESLLEHFPAIVFEG